MGSLLLPLGPHAHTTLCVPSKSGVSVSPSPLKVLQSNPASLQSLILCEFPLPLPDPHVGKPDVVSEASLQWVDFCSIIVLKFVATHPAFMGFDFIVIVPLLPLIVASPLSLDVGYLFW